MDCHRVSHIYASLRRPRLRSTWVAAFALSLFFGLASTDARAQLRCPDDDLSVDRTGRTSEAAPEVVFDATPARERMRIMVLQALERSQTVGSSRLLSEAAAADLKETGAQGVPRASASVTANQLGQNLAGAPGMNTHQAVASVSVGAPLYDGGRIATQVEWRRQLLEAARLGLVNTEEQIALQAVSNALERARYRMQGQIYMQYGRKMRCLADALEAVTKVDRGRASEMVQARKSVQQVDLSYAQTLSGLRQTEVRLRKLVGDGLPSTEGFASLFLKVPSLNDLLVDADLSSDLAQLKAQAEAQDKLARLTSLATKPQVAWSVGTSRTAGYAEASAWNAGVSVTIPLYSPGADSATLAAARRAESTRMQVREAIESKRSRVAEAYEQAQSAFDRARRVAEVLKDSEQVRGFTIQQWQQLGRRSLFDVMSAEADHYGLRIAYINALFDGQQSVVLLQSLGRGVRSAIE